MGKLTKIKSWLCRRLNPGRLILSPKLLRRSKEITFTKFDASFDIDVRLGVDPRKADQMVRGVVSLPHGTGKQVRVLVLCNPDAEAAAKRLAPTMSVLTNISQKSKVVGLMLTLSSLSRL